MQRTSSRYLDILFRVSEFFELAQKTGLTKRVLQVWFQVCCIQIRIFNFWTFPEWQVIRWHSYITSSLARAKWRRQRRDGDSSPPFHAYAPCDKVSSFKRPPHQIRKNKITTPLKYWKRLVIYCFKAVSIDPCNNSSLSGVDGQSCESLNLKSPGDSITFQETCWPLSTDKQIKILTSTIIRR